jgi:hypothetical protein
MGLQGAAVAVLIAACAGAAAASTWCGENGVVRLSFSGESVEPVARVEPDGDGLTAVDVYALLCDVAPLQHRGEAFLAIGGFELQLLVEGAEATVGGKTYPGKVIDIGTGPRRCTVGFDPSLPLEKDGTTELVHWRVEFAGPVSDVTFRLDPSALTSCAELAGCPESGTQALYTGSVAAKQVQDIFGAGYVPAVLNPSGEPDLAPVRGGVGWEQVGYYAERE